MRSARVNPPGPGPTSITLTPSNGPAARAMRRDLGIRHAGERRGPRRPRRERTDETAPRDDEASREAARRHDVRRDRRDAALGSQGEEVPLERPAGSGRGHQHEGIREVDDAAGRGRAVKQRLREGAHERRSVRKPCG